MTLTDEELERALSDDAARKEIEKRTAAERLHDRRAATPGETFTLSDRLRGYPDARADRNRPAERSAEALLARRITVAALEQAERMLAAGDSLKTLEWLALAERADILAARL